MGFIMGYEFLSNTLNTIKRGVELGKFPNELYEILSRPERTLHVTIPIRMDNGKIAFFEGFRVQHNSALGPYKGGIRFHEKVDVYTDTALATLMTIKNSLAGLPYGGGKGAVKVDPKRLSQNELERLSRGYIRAIAPLIGEKLDIPAPDVGTNSQIMAWMVDEYIKIKGINEAGVITSKPVELWGNPVRNYSTGYGCYVCAREAAKEYLGGLKNIRVSVQGFGNVGMYAAYWCAKDGAKIIAISDTSGTIYNPNGLDIEKLIKVKMETGAVSNYEDAQLIKDSKAALYVDADIQIPSALENQITIENVKNVKGKIIVEGANGPTTPDAEEYLTKNGIIVVPDFLANAGGVIMSYLEWVENLQWYLWDEEETRSKLEKIMMSNFHRVNNKYKELKKNKPNISMRDAAMVAALERLYNTMKVRGWL